MFPQDYMLLLGFSVAAGCLKTSMAHFSFTLFALEFLAISCLFGAAASWTLTLGHTYAMIMAMLVAEAAIGITYCVSLTRSFGTTKSSIPPF